MSKKFGTFAGDKLKWSTRMPGGYFTVMAWVKWNSSSAVFRPWFYRCNQSSNPFIYSGLDNSGVLHTSWILPTGSGQSVDGGSPTIGTWHHVALTCTDFQTIAVYFNGAFVGVNTSNGTKSYTTDLLYFGLDDDTDAECGLCSLSCVKFWDGMVLTLDEIHTEMWTARAAVREGLLIEAPLQNALDPYAAPGQTWDTISGDLTDPDEPPAVDFWTPRRRVVVSQPAAGAAVYSPIPALAAGFGSAF